MTPARGPRRTRARSSLLRAVDPRHLEELQSLRKLFVEPERARLEHLERPISPELVGNLLPEALAHASEARGDGLATAIDQPVTSALRNLARRTPELFGEMLAPTIGTAVRRAVANALAAILERVNRVIERSLSLRSFAWRFEARRRGRPFAEVMLAHTLLYRVEWVVLIHTETSLVLEQATVEDTPPPLDQMSAMLQAINAFVSDAFQPTVPGADLQSFEVGDLTVWIERDPAVTLAAAIRGVAPVELRGTFRQTLERVRTLHHEQIVEPCPDLGKLADLRPLLVDCLQQKYRPMRRRAQWLLAALGIAVVAFAVAAQARGGAAAREDARLRAEYRAALAEAPGIVVTAITRDDGRYRYRIEGLRDPRAAPADALIAAAGLPAASLELAPFDSLDPRFPRAEPPLAAVDAALRELEAIEIPFGPGTLSVGPAERAAIERAAQLVGRARRAAAQARAGLCVEVIGDADETGTAAINAAVRSARADGVVRALAEAGVEPELLRPGVADAMRPKPGRRVTFRAGLRPDPDHPGCRP
jgi:outer membrane protein OmpA-like peptidoglycan-associated protein